MLENKYSNSIHLQQEINEKAKDCLILERTTEIYCNKRGERDKDNRPSAH